MPPDPTSTRGAAPPEPASTRRTAPGSRPPSLDAAREALARGDMRTARRLARQIAATGTDSERAAARRLLADLAPDPAALLAAAVVLVVIAVAAWLALFRAH